MRAIEYAVQVVAMEFTAPFEERIEAAQRLDEYGIFSRNNIAELAGLSEYEVLKAIPVARNRGGRLSASTLSLMYDLMLEYETYDMLSIEKLKAIVDSGTSLRFIERLTGIPQPSMSRWLKNGRRG